MSDLKPFELIDNTANSSVIIHVPHGGLWIPEDCLEDFVLQGVALENEAQLMADLDTIGLAKETYRLAAKKPSMFINNVSRLVFDPERFDDESEEMNQVGMGVLYTKTSDQQQLRVLSPERKTELKNRFYYPYASEISDLVDRALDAHGRVLIIDLHSYAAEALPYELHKDKSRPALCVGVDSFHTPQTLVEKVTTAFTEIGSIAINEPFAGSYVPLKHYGKNDRVESVMLELIKQVFALESAESTARLISQVIMQA